MPLTDEPGVSTRISQKSPKKNVNRRFGLLTAALVRNVDADFVTWQHWNLLLYLNWKGYFFPSLTTEKLNPLKKSGQ